MKLDDLQHFRIDKHHLYDVKDQLKQLVYGRSLAAFAAGDRARDALDSKESIETRRTALRERFIHALGGLPPGNTPLAPSVTGTVECDGFRIEKVIFQSRPSTYVTGDLYIPDGVDAPRGAVLFVCGHHLRAKHEGEYQTVCRHLVHAGLVVFAIDPIGQGERLSYYESLLGKETIPFGTAEHDYAGAQCYPLGDSIARYFVHDMIRAVDYLCTRPEVDPAAIGVTGNSGGGTQTSLAMICDPRIAAAAPATFIMDRESFMWTGMAQDAEQIWPGMTAWGFDHEDILLAMAPRPVLVLAVTYDFFPIEGTRRTVERARRFWDLYGEAGKLVLFEDRSLHAYTASMAEAAAAFFAKHLLGAPSLPAAAAAPYTETLEPSLLWCTGKGQVREQFADARGAYEENVARIAEIERDRASVPDDVRMKRALSWLRDKVFNDRGVCDLNPRRNPLGQWGELTVESVVWWSQKGILNHALLFRHYRHAGTRLPLTIALWDGGTSRLQPHVSWIRDVCGQNREVMALDVTGVGALVPNAINPHGMHETLGTLFKLATELFWLDDSLAALRAYDVLRALDVAELLAGNDREDIHCYAHGYSGLYGQLAAALDRRPTKWTFEGGYESVAAWVRSRYYDATDTLSYVMPGMLRYFDLPDLKRWNVFSR